MLIQKNIRFSGISIPIQTNEKKSLENRNNFQSDINFTSTFEVLNAKGYKTEIIDNILEDLRKILTKNIKTGGNCSCKGDTEFGDIDTKYRSFYEKWIDASGFEIIKNVLYHRTERPFVKTENNLPYNKIIVSVPNNKDDIIKKFFDDNLIKYNSKPLDSEKNCKYVLINSNENNIDFKHSLYFHFDILSNFFEKIKDNFKILTANANKNSGTEDWVGEIELRVPNNHLFDLEDNLKNKGHKYNVSDTPKYLKY